MWCNRCVRVRLCVQVLLLAKHRRKSNVHSIVLSTGDAEPPEFTSLPVVETSNGGTEISFATDKPAMVYWALLYSDISAAFRYHLLGFESSQLSSAQVLDVAKHGTRASSLRGLQEALEEAASPSSGPVVAWGSQQITAANAMAPPVSINTTSAPCLADTGMCLLSFDAINPETDYKVRSMTSCIAPAAHTLTTRIAPRNPDCCLALYA